MDFDGHFLTLKNGSVDATRATGWALRSLKTKEEFKLPDGLSIPSGQSIRVWTGKNAKQRAATSGRAGDLVWPSSRVEGLWDTRVTRLRHASLYITLLPVFLLSLQPPDASA